MLYSEARAGRIFVIRLEHGEVLHETIEAFAVEQGIRAATFVVVGGADEGSTLVVGPRDGEERPVVPMERVLQGAHEVAGTGTLFPNEKGKPVVHAHLACGREGATTTGCVRRGVRVWQVMEVILMELVDPGARRVRDDSLGFDMLRPPRGGTVPPAGGR